MFKRREKCVYCGDHHSKEIICPRVKSIEYYADGVVKRVEVFSPVDMGKIRIVPSRGAYNL